jgi:hypothetical protein
MGKILIGFCRKIPGPEQYSSLAANCSIEMEIQPGQDLRAESARLFSEASGIVDKQLGLAQSTHAPQGAHALRVPAPAGAEVAKNNGNGNHRPGRATAAQLRLLESLLGDNREQRESVLAHYRVRDLQELTIKNASEAIDELKQHEPVRR